MKIYLVRHAETNGNIAKRHQSDITHLTSLGEQQANKAAKQIKLLKPTHLITSSLVRAIETARVIGRECDLIPETSEYFTELKRPEFLWGNYHTSFRSLWFYAKWYLGCVDEKHGGESYAALRQRFVKAKEYLAAYPEDASLVVVSHAVFINLFIAHLCRERALWPLRALVAFLRIVMMPNTHIVTLEFNGGDKVACPWTVICR